MKERAISFAPDMASAAYAGRKTMTRRVMRIQHTHKHLFAPDTTIRVEDGIAKWFRADSRDCLGNPMEAWDNCPYGKAGDRLYVRSSWRTLACYDALKPSELPNAAPVLFDFVDDEDLQKASVWGRRRAARFLPKRFAAFWLEVVSVSVERLQDISLMDCIAEGVRIPISTDGKRLLKVGGKHSPASYLPKGSGFPDNNAHLRAEFAALWDSINGGKEGCSWDDNCFVWVVEFKRITQ